MVKKICFVPGPAELFYTFNDHLKKAVWGNIPSLSHRSSKFVKIIGETTNALSELLEIPSGYDIFFLSSANEAWDRIVQNLTAEKSHHFVNGAFSKKFYDFALLYGRNSSSTQVKDGGTFDDLSVPEDAELIGITKNETSIGYTFNEEDIARLRSENPKKIIALDIVSASPSLPVNLSHIDTAYFSVQKGFGLPPGLGVWIANQKCQEKASEIAQYRSLGSYRTLPNLKKFADKHQTPETPNTLAIYLLGEIAKDMLKIGKQKIQNDTIYKSTILYQAAENNENLSPFVRSAKHRSRSTLVFETYRAREIIDHFEKMGLILGSGHGIHKNDHIRIANFPTHSRELMEMISDKLEKLK